MGEVFSPERVASGAIPAADGSDHEQAAGLVMNFVRSSPLTSAHSQLLIAGSTATGRANRRSDIDYLLVDAASGPEGVPDLAPHRMELQARFITETMDYAASYYNVRFEGQRYTEAQLRRAGRAIYDAFWLAHGLDVQDNHPDFVHGKPLERLRPYAIGFEVPENPEMITLASAIAIRYMAGKVNIFGEAGDFDPSGTRDLRRLQRAFEAPKALARKMVMMSAIGGREVTAPDVTSRQSMKEEMDDILSFDSTGRLARYNDWLSALDEEYDGVLDEAVRGSVAPYERWLRDTYLPACAMALRLAEGCAAEVDRITWGHPAVSFWRYGIDIEGEFDADFALHHSLSEPIAGSPAPEEETSRRVQGRSPLLVNMWPEQLEELIALRRGTS